MYYAMFLGGCFPSHDCAMVYWVHCKLWMIYFVLCIPPLRACLPLLLLIKKNLGHGPLSYTPPWEGMFLLCLLPKIQILCDVPEFLYLCELQRYDIVFLVHVRWNYIRNVSCFLQKKFVCKHFACSLWWHNELPASIITYYVRISNDMWTYTWSIHTFIAQNMINV
jgi:hypothetical protein